jgi:hypothetical protein
MLKNFAFLAEPGFSQAEFPHENTAFPGIPQNPPNGTPRAIEQAWDLLGGSCIQ